MPIDQHITARFAAISELIDEAKTWAGHDPHLGAHLAGYICVLLSGAIEDSVEHMFSLRMASVPDSEVGNYVLKMISQRFRNPNSANISGLLGDFSKEYQLQWSAKFPSNHRLHETLLSILNNKNGLAHEGTMKLQLSMGDIEHYFNEVVPAINELEQIIVGPVKNDVSLDG